ncbi:DUF3892 domain-containing protein [Pseudomonas sp. D3]|uniref:DUF3892 domain-containing protein n=1 Tax=Pseudomonas sp. D3 TaxID=517398 RepID=UPI0023E470C1|nr:DUF3892 domain-containing protein [Pseudomonas sp. D3]WET08860.1 DUF3892 domain-containing protein [Pseudomonas sp. D3]
MADFCITKVKYSSDGQHIEWLAVREELEKTVGTERLVQRAFVASLIRLGRASFITRVWDQVQETFKKGADVHVVEDHYLSTDRNNSKRDNLGSLPLIKSALLAS